MNQNHDFRFLNVGLPDDILRHKQQGNLAQAIRLIDLRLAEKATPPALAACLRAQREMMTRLPKDYPFPREQALERVRREIADFSEEEFDALVERRRIGWIYLDGQMRYFRRFFETLCVTEADIARRAGRPLPGTDKRCQRIRAANERLKQLGQIQNRIRIRASLCLRDDLFTPGMFLRAQLPVPCACQEQSDIRMESVSPADGVVAAENAPQRTVCWQGRYETNPTFQVEYSYTRTAVYHDLTAEPCYPQQPVFDTEESAPHIVFSPYIRALCQSLTQGAANPIDKARRFYDFITLNMRYSFMPEYFVLEDIAASCARNLTGDCGVLALLFITLCRCAGIPAQWQSGLDAQPDECGAHDWARFYAAPYGWLPVDPSYGVSAAVQGDEERRQFYFGNMDAFRMAANSRFQADFETPMQFWRADPYDNQSGEMETDTHALTGGDYESRREVVDFQEIETNGALCSR